MVTATEIREAATALSHPERADLAAYLISSLQNEPYWVEDQEVSERMAQMQSGEEKGLTRKEFWAQCGR
jgi:Putative addiction module component